VKVSPLQFKKLFEHTHQVLRLYYNKEKWSVIYPSITQLAERFVLSYAQKPGALHAHLQFYAKEQGYTTNLVVNQAILVAAICHSLGYSKELSESLVIAAISDQICTSNETNKLATGKALTEQASRLVENRHALAVKMLNKGQVPTGQVQRILARLDKYASAITGVKAVPLYDNPSIIVAIAMRIAKAITPRARVKTFSVNQAIKSLYLSCYNEFAQNALTQLAEQLVKYPAGLSVSYKNEQCIVLARENKISYLALML
jgi:HD-GYP domain-containing protein (c-di-GMP phosphodiesterase class II)